MDAGLALHTAARRYCLERYTMWFQRYFAIAQCGGDREPDGYHCTPEALWTFPRHNVLDAIRVELERLDPAELGDFDTAKSRVIWAGEIANSAFTNEPIGAIEKQAITEERLSFCDYVRVLTTADLCEVESLPFRRVLSTSESDAIWSLLRDRWQITKDYWYPLTKCSRQDVVAFDAQNFNDAVPPARLQEILTSCGVERVWELREYGPEYEQEVALFEPKYNGAEGYWSSSDLDWIVYASHENTVTIAGRMFEEIKALWPNWSVQVWRG